MFILACRTRTHNSPMVYRICTENHTPKGHLGLRLRPYMVSDVIARFTVAQPDVAGTVMHRPYDSIRNHRSVGRTPALNERP